MGTTVPCGRSIPAAASQFIPSIRAAESGPTPSRDLRGPDTETTSSYDSLRPSVTETSAEITARTESIQAAIDRAAAFGGGNVYIPNGLFQINQIVLKDRVQLIGAGKGRTILLASPDIGSTESLIITEDFADNKTLFEASPTTAPRWRVNGALNKMAIRHLTLDGNGYTLTAPQGDWDIDDLQEPNVAKTNVGIQVFGAGTVFEEVRVMFFSSHGVEIYRGSDTKSGAITAADDVVTHIVSLQCGYNAGDGLHIYAHPDGIIEYYEADANGGWGGRIDGSHWHIHTVHTYGNNQGWQNNGTYNFYDNLECENEQLEGFINTTSGFGCDIKTLVLFENCRLIDLVTPANMGDAYAVLNDATTIHNCPKCQIDSNGGVFTGIKISATGIHTKILALDATPATGDDKPTGAVAIDMTENTIGICDIRASLFWGQSGTELHAAEDARHFRI